LATERIEEQKLLIKVLTVEQIRLDKLEGEERCCNEAAALVAQRRRHLAASASLWISVSTATVRATARETTYTALPGAT
jgi:hypothetical protein